MPELPQNLPIDDSDEQALPNRPTPPPLPPRPVLPTLPIVPKPFVPSAPTPPAPVAPKPFTPPAPPMPSLPPRPVPPPTPPAPMVPPRPIPPAPLVRPPEISLRTMKSDLGAPAPVSPTIDLRQGLTPTAPPKGLTKVPGRPSRMKPILIILGVLVFGAALAGLGYFVIFPYFFPAETPAPILTPTQKSPNAVDLTPAAAPAPATAPRIHQSLLKIPAATQTQSFVSLLNLNNLRQILTTESSLKPSGTDVLKELLLSDANGQISFSDTLPLFIPELAAGELSNIFENDFTALIYFDANGAWPAWVAKLKTGVAVANAKNLISRLETSAGLMNLFIANPGAPTGTFKTGQVGSVQTRYLPFPQKGASLNYAFVGDKLIISASFNGLKRILNSL